MRTRDEGSAMVSAMVVMLVLLVLSLGLMSTSVATSNVAIAERATSAARASAQSGVSQVRLALLGDRCTPEMSGDDFDASVSHSSGLRNADGTVTWTPGCPDATASLVRIVSIGHAGAGPAARDAAVQAVLERGAGTAAPPVIAPTISPSTVSTMSYLDSYLGDEYRGKPAMFGPLAINAQELHKDCNSKIVGDLVVTGNFELGDGCDVTGDLYVDWLTVAPYLASHITIGGDLIARQIDFHSLSSAGTQGAITVMGDALIDEKATLHSRVTIAGSLSSPQTARNGAHVASETRMPFPGLPTLPTWPEIPSPTSSNATPAWFTSPNDYNRYTVTGDVCSNLDYWKSILVSTDGRPVLADATACGNATLWTSTSLAVIPTVTINSDVVILTRGGIQLTGAGAVAAAPGTSPRLWLVQADDYDDDSAICVGGGITVGGRFSIATSIRTMIYTPCALVIASNISGRVFAQSVYPSPGTVITPAPIPLPTESLTATGYGELDPGALPSTTRDAPSDRGVYAMLFQQDLAAGSIPDTTMLPER